MECISGVRILSHISLFDTKKYRTLGHWEVMRKWRFEYGEC